MVPPVPPQLLIPALPVVVAASWYLRGRALWAVGLDDQSWGVPGSDLELPTATEARAIARELQGVSYLVAPALPADQRRRLVVAALVNAWAESRLDPRAVGDAAGTVEGDWLQRLTADGAGIYYSSVGLWQMHKDGLGRGMSSAARRSLPDAASVMLREAIRQGVHRAASDAEAVSTFTARVERPASSTAPAERAALLSAPPSALRAALEVL